MRGLSTGSACDGQIVIVQLGTKELVPKPAQSHQKPEKQNHDLIPAITILGLTLELGRI